MSDIVVIGSINVDMVVTTKMRPKVGETVTGEAFRMLPGGKGINQAISAHSLGADIEMIGCLGDDMYSDYLRDYYKKGNIFLSHVEHVPHTSTGVAQIVIADNDNSIIVIPGANHKLSKKLIDKNIEIIVNAKIVVLQLEINMEVVEYVIDICKKNDIAVLLNPAPAVKLNQGIIDGVTYITPNLEECKIIFASEDVDHLLEKYPNKLIVTKGDEGVVYHNGEQICVVPAEKVDVIDTTGAGDAFNGALATYISLKYELVDAIRLANKHAASCVTHFGAQPSIEDLERSRNDE